MFGFSQGRGAEVAASFGVVAGKGAVFLDDDDSAGDLDAGGLGPG